MLVYARFTGQSLLLFLPAHPAALTWALGQSPGISVSVCHTQLVRAYLR